MLLKASFTLGSNFILWACFSIWKMANVPLRNAILVILCYHDIRTFFSKWLFLLFISVINIFLVQKCPPKKMYWKQKFKTPIISSTDNTVLLFWSISFPLSPFYTCSSSFIYPYLYIHTNSNRKNIYITGNQNVFEVLRL